jgi:transposase-like protein
MSQDNCQCYDARIDQTSCPSELLEIAISHIHSDSKTNRGIWFENDMKSYNSTIRALEKILHMKNEHSCLKFLDFLTINHSFLPKDFQKNLLGNLMSTCSQVIKESDILQKELKLLQVQE